MLTRVLFAFFLVTGSASAEEDVLLGTGCYKRVDMQAIVDLPGDDDIMLSYQYVRDGKCVPTVTTEADWDAGPEIADTGVKAAYTKVWNWTDGTFPPAHHPKQVMYFDASSGDE